MWEKGFRTKASRFSKRHIFHFSPKISSSEIRNNFILLHRIFLRTSPNVIHLRRSSSTTHFTYVPGANLDADRRKSKIGLPVTTARYSDEVLTLFRLLSPRTRAAVTKAYCVFLRLRWGYDVGRYTRLRLRVSFCIPRWRSVCTLVPTTRF